LPEPAGVLVPKENRILTIRPGWPKGRSWGAI
jgi:hypothetical protein